MDMNSMAIESLSSVRQALGVAALRKSMSQDAASVSSLIEGMEKANTKTMELSVAPNLGSKFDVSI